MSRNRASLALILLLAAPLCRARDDPGNPHEGARIEAVRFRGADWIPRGHLETVLGVASGDRYSASAMATGMERLLSWHPIATISAPEITPIETGITLTFEVEARPRVRSVTIRGLRHLDEDTLLGEIDLEGAGTSLETSLEEARRAIVARLRAGGHYFAEVDVRSRPVPGAPGNVDVELVVEEGPRVTIRKIRVTGNASISTRRILGILESRRRILFGILSPGEFKPEAFERDLERIRVLYRRRGFLDVRVFRDSLEFSDDLDEVTPAIGIEEGPRHELEAIEIRGHNPALLTALERQIRTRPGGHYDGDRLEEDRVRMLEFYQRRTFRQPHIELAHRFHLDPADNRVRAVFIIDERRHLFAGRVEVRGNLRTLDRVVRASATVFPGGPLTSLALRDTENRVRATGIFGKAETQVSFADSPLYRLPQDPSLEPSTQERYYQPGDVRDVNLSVTEKAEGYFEVGGGASSGEGEIFLVKLTHPNVDIFDLPGGARGWKRPFTGGGQFLEVEAFPGTRISEFRFLFEEPYLYNSYHALSLAGNGQIFRWRKFDEIHYRGEIGVRRHWDELRRFSTRLSWVLEDVAIVNTRRDIPGDVKDVKGHTFFSYPSLHIGYRDIEANFYGGPAGLQAWTRLDIPTRGTGSESEYFRTLTSVDYYFRLDSLLNAVLPGEPLHADNPEMAHTLRVGGRFGWIENIAGGEAPFYDRFMLGGPRNFRGFSYRGLGPRSGSIPLGGEAFWQGTLEYSFPLGLRELRAVGLFDFGDIEESFSGLAANRIRTAVGGGLQVRLRILGQAFPLNLFWVEALRKEDRDRDRFFTFTLGYFF